MLKSLLYQLKTKLKANQRLRDLLPNGLYYALITAELASNKKALLTNQTQTLLKLQFQNLKNMGLKPSQLPSFQDVGFKVYSQCEEDGILLYLFSMIGTVNQRVVEICAGSGHACMASNLIIHHDWEGLLFDGDRNHVRWGKYFFKQQRLLCPPNYQKVWLTVENINSLIYEAGFAGEVDLLSLDIDGNDYWIWQAIEVVSPRVLVCEVNNAIPEKYSLTIPYQADFFARGKAYPESLYLGFSLAAMVKLCHQKGYRLIGANRHGFNCFFMRNDIGQEYFPEVSIEQCFNNPYTQNLQKKAWPLLQNFEWLEV